MGNYLSVLHNDPPHRNHVSHAHPAATVTTASTNTTVTTRQSSSTRFSTCPQYDVFISHAGEDKATIAIPLREKLVTRGITAFVDEVDMAPGTEAKQAMINAMETAKVAVIVLSPEFVAREWPMKELMCFLRRREESDGASGGGPVIIPFFYRLSIAELHDEPRLDRKDREGNLLYVKSRFYERQKNGEPEASIEGIKGALMAVRGIMGVRNDVEASNDAAYIMSRRREMLLRDLCERVDEVASPTEMTARGRDVRAECESFCAHFDAPYDTSKLVFEFDAKDDDGNASTQEGRLLKLVLDESPDRNREIAVRGMGGVGKTSLLRAISGSDTVKERFEDGVYSIILARDATLGELVDSLSTVVQNSGGKLTATAMRSETKIKKVMNMFRSWFANKQCLFIVDDVWETKDIPCSIIHELTKLRVTGRDSKVLLTTRTGRIAAEADASFGLVPRNPLEQGSQAILTQYSGIELEEGAEDDKKVVDTILEYCSGLPLFLAVAGKTVKTLSFRSGHGGCVAYHGYARILEASRQSLLGTCIGGYDKLSAQLLSSLELVEDRKQELEFRIERRMGEIHRRLSVMTKQMSVPMSMLKELWELENESEAASVAKEFEQVGLCDIEFKKTGCGVIEVLRLHDSVYEFAVSETGKHEEEKLGHETLLRRYGANLVGGEKWGKWWDKCLEPDGYIHGNVCRHLLGAGRGSDVVQLLLQPQWAERQVKVNGIRFLKDDLAVGMEAVHKRMEGCDEEECCETEKALELISDAVALSSPSVSKNDVELWFQLHGRLKRYGDNNRAIRKYVGWMETEPPRPRVLCLNDVLGGAGGSNTNIVYVGTAVFCMVMLGDGKRIACGSFDGYIWVVNIHESEIDGWWKAHDGVVLALAVGREGTRLVSGSLDGKLRVWDVGSLKTSVGSSVTFHGHSDRVTDVQIMKDEERVVSVSRDGTAQIWEMDTGLLVLPPLRGHEGPVNCVTVLRDRDEIITGGSDGKLILWSAMTGAQLGDPFEGHEDLICCVAVTPDGHHIVSGSEDCTLRMWDVESHEQVLDSFKGHSDPVLFVAASSDGSRVISGSADRTIRIWDSQSGKPVGDPLEGHGGAVCGVSFLKSVDSCSSCSWDGTVRVWDARRSKPQTVADRHFSAVSGVSFTTNGEFVVSGSLDKTVRIWDATTGQQIGDPLSGHSDFVNDVAVTPDGRYIVSVSDDKTVGVWCLGSRELLRTFVDHTDAIRCVAVTPNGKHAVTGSSDKTVRIWDLSAMDGSHVVLEGHNATVRRVFVTDDSLRIVSVDIGGEIIVWGLETQNVIKRFKNEQDPFCLSRQEVLKLFGESTVHENARLSIRLARHHVVYSEGLDAKVLATVESPVQSWALSPDKKTVCVGLADGLVGFLKVET